MKSLSNLMAVGCLLAWGFVCRAETLDLNQFRNDIVNNKVVKAKIIYLPYSVESFMSITPEMLNKLPNTTVATVHVAGGLKASFLKAIENTTATSGEFNCDMRWGAIFYDTKNNQCHSIYIDRRFVNRSANYGFIDGRNVSVNGALIDWFESNFMPKKTSVKT
jgi:hypothetical protein